MAPIYVDEATGSDTTGNGAQNEPYQSLGFAIFTHGPDIQLLFRKDATASFEEPTQSSVKKAKKNAEGLEKKKKKQEELAARDTKEKAEEKERRERLVEESKKIVLTEDASLPKAIKVPRLSNFLWVWSHTSPISPQSKISALTGLRSKRVRVFGWVHRLRNQKDIIFIVLRDGTGYLQTILSGRVVCPFVMFSDMTIHNVLNIGPNLRCSYAQP